MGARRRGGARQSGLTVDRTETEWIRAVGLSKSYPLGGGLFRRPRKVLKALRNVSLSLRKGEVTGLVGESGSGKSTFGRSLLRLTEPDAGQVILDGENILRLSRRDMKRVRRRCQVIFQDPFASLSPRMNVRDILCEPLDIHDIGNRNERTDRAAELLETVGLRAEHLRRYPHEFSGGQRQRICIARAIAPNPEFILADEPVSALDVSLQAQIVNLLAEMRRRFSLTMLFITHDLSLVEYLCDRIAVMYAGTIVETGPVADLCGSPLHPYTRILLSAIPRVDPRRKMVRMFMKDERGNATDASSNGCIFAGRCPRSQPDCLESAPPMRASETSPDHLVACRFPGDF